MASGKTYEMLFALNAALNSNFQGTFNKAQQEFSKLGKEIQSLQRLQANVSSYQKQEQAIASTTTKLSNLQQQHDLLQKEINETTGSTAGLEREKLRLEQRIKDTETALERQRQKLDATGQKLQEAGVDTNNLAQADARLTEQIKELQAQQDRTTDSVSSFTEQAVQGFGAIQNAIAAAGIADALGEIKDAYLECVTIAADFEEGMSNVEALSGATSKEMAELTAKAKELGAETKYTALQSSQAMGFMSMAGWNAQQMMSGMTGVINLAAASGEDLARVSDIVTDNLTAFGLTAADTAHFSDVLAAAATKSNTSVSIMGETFKQSASIAGALGYSIEDVAVATGLMANAGVKGSIAGTALKNTFNGLLEGATLTSAAFGEYEFSAIRADGTMKSFSDTINELRGYFEQMTEAERVNNAMTIAGQRGYNGLLAILNATDADYASLTNSINNCTGAAQRMAEIKLDNLKGQLTLMNSAWDALKTTIGEEFNPELRRMAEIGTDALTLVNGFVLEHPALVRGIMAAVGAVGAGVAVLTGVATVTKVLIPLMGTLSATIPGVNVILGVTAAVAGVVGVVTALATAADNGIPSVKELTEATRKMREAMEESGLAFEQTANQALATAQVAETYIAKLEELGEGTDASNEHSRTYLNTLSLLCNAIPELTEYVNLETGAIDGGTEALRKQTEAWKQNAEAQAYQEYMNSLYSEYNDVMTEAAANSIKLTEAEIKLENIEKSRAADLARMNELEKKGVALTAEEQTEYYRLQDALVGYNSEILDAADAIKTYTKAVEKDNEALAEAETVLNDAQEAYERLTGVTEAQTEAEAEAARQTAALNDVIGSTMEQVASLTETYEKAYNAAFESVSGQYDLWDEAEKVVATSAGNINKALESQITYWQDYNTNLESLRERTGDIEGLSDVIASFADGSKDSVNAIAGLAQASDEDLQAMVTNWKELQKEQEAAAGSIADLKTDFSATMDELQADLAEDIKAMDLGDEAAKNGEATIQGYIDGATAMLPQVQAAYADLASAAVNALGNNTRYSNTWAAQFDPARVNAYATGTSNAPPGWAWVGEKGPELIRMRGGETVLPATVSKEFALLTAYKDEIAAYAGGTDNASAVVQEATRLTEISNAAYASYNTAAYNHNSAAYHSASYQTNTTETASTDTEAVPAPVGGFGAPITVEVHIHLEGNVPPETVQALDDYVRRGELQEAVADAMENIQADALRGAYT